MRVCVCVSARAFFLHQHHHHHHHHHQPDSCVFLSIIIQHFGHSNVAIVINVRCIISYVVCVRLSVVYMRVWARDLGNGVTNGNGFSYNALLYYRCSVYASHTRPRARLRTNEMCVWFLFDNNKRSQSATFCIRQCAIIKMLENEQNNLYIFIWFVFFVYIIIYTEKNYDLKIQIWKYCRSFSCLCMFEYPKQRFTAHSFTVFLNFFLHRSSFGIGLSQRWKSTIFLSVPNVPICMILCTNTMGAFCWMNKSLKLYFDYYYW